MLNITKFHFEFSNFFNGFMDHIYASIRTSGGNMGDMLLSSEFNHLYGKYEFCKLLGFVMEDSTYCALNEKKQIFLSEWETFDVRDLPHTMLGTEKCGHGLYPECFIVALNPSIEPESARTLIRIHANSLQEMIKTEFYQKINETTQAIKLVVGFDTASGDQYILADPIMLHRSSEIPNDFSIFERIFFKVT